MAKALYICYFGVREPLVQTQVLPYLRELLKDGHEISLLTFEPLAGEGEKGRRGDEAIRAELAADGIEWHWLRYHKRLSAIATAYDIFNGAWLIRQIIGKKKLDILHGRVHVPTLMGALARKFSRRKPKLLFDIRGFFPEEYTDAGVWPENGILYRAAKRIETWLMKEADGFVVLTEKAREILFPESATSNQEGSYDKIGRPVEVIPCCVDLRRFEVVNADSRAQMRKKLATEDRYVMVYVGSFGGWYLTEETADFYAELKRSKPDSFALVLTQSKPEMIESLLRARGFNDGDFLITRVSPGEIPLYLGAGDAAVSFIKPCYSKQASSPTKNAEYLACGLPIIVNDGVGDTTQFTEADRTGIVIGEFSRDAYSKALRDLDDLLADQEVLAARCRESAFRRFNLVDVGGQRYRRIYARLRGAQ